jgi:ArsR family transcriptional regulator, lead/cadmium/zinc/bismuth-responsive transcriptional repressor
VNIYSCDAGEVTVVVTSAAYSTDAAAVEADPVHIIAWPLAERLAETFKVLGDPARVRILSALAGTELCVRDLSTALQMTQSATSHQLSILRRMHLIHARKQGRQVFYALDDEHIEQIFQRGLEHVAHG